jgi:hypothetical protein
MLVLMTVSMNQTLGVAGEEAPGLSGRATQGIR